MTIGRRSRLDERPVAGQIEFKGASRLTLADRRLFNVLLRTAFGPDLATENRRFEIPIAELRESVARRVRLKHVFMERFSLADFRELLSVEKGNSLHPLCLYTAIRIYVFTYLRKIVCMNLCACDSAELR